MRTSGPLVQLQEALQAAQKRCKAAALALAPKRKGGEWEEYRSAEEAVLASERALAAARGESYAVRFDFPVLWDTGAPLPYLLQNDNRTFLIFFVGDPDPYWDGSHVNVREPGSLAASKLALVEFKGCISAKMGTPNDEVFHGHPLYGRGLESYRPLRVQNSAWLKEVEKINSVHGAYVPEVWTRRTHYFFGFHDSTFECIAESVVLERREASLPEVLTEVCERLVA
jgi:hypothetical protein